MNTYSRILTVIEYIEGNIQAKMTLDDIAQTVYVSKYHLHRAFYSLTKMQLMEYVRCRKLSCSTDELLHTKHRIADIAQSYGFEYEQSYIRAFKKLFGVSPARLRSSRVSCKIVDKLNLKVMKAVEDGVLMPCEVVVKPEFSVVGIKSFVRHADNVEYNVANTLGKDFYYHHRSEIKKALHPNVYIGLSLYSNTTHGESYYLPSLEVSEVGHIPEGMGQEVVPAHKYAVFKYIGFHSPDEISIKTLSGIYSYIGQWFQISGHAQAAKYHFERIDVDLARDDYCETEIYVPIK